MNPIQFEEQTGSLYRLRSARNKRRARIEDRDKRLRALDAEQSSLQKQYDNRPWVKLDEPYQRGWVRHFELSQATALHKDAIRFAKILKVINTVQYHHRKDFTKKKRMGGRKLRFGIEQYLSKLSSLEWADSGLDRQDAELFEWRPGLDAQGRFRFKLVFTQPWRYELKVRPNLIDSVRLAAPDLQSRLQEIDNRIDRHHLNPRRNKVVYGWSYRWFWKDSTAPHRIEKRAFRRIPLHRLLLQIQSQKEAVHKGQPSFFAFRIFFETQ